MGQRDNRILLIDDEEGILVTLRSFLGRRGYEVDCAHDPIEAQRYLSHTHYALVITDLYLTPSQSDDGLQIVDRVRQDHPETRIALLTGYGTPELEHRALGLGADVLLHKSLRLSDIAGTVAELVNGMPVRQGG